MFTAIAMVAFVGSSMASNNITYVDPPTISSCITQAMAHLDEICAYDTMTDQQILEEFNSYFDRCYGTKKVVTKLEQA